MTKTEAMEIVYALREYLDFKKADTWHSLERTQAEQDALAEALALALTPTRCPAWADGEHFWEVKGVRGMRMGEAGSGTVVKLCACGAEVKRT